MKTIQQAVSEYVADKSTTKDAMAKELGFSRSAFFMKLRGDSEFTLSEAYRLSRAIGCTVDDVYEMTRTA